EFEGSESYTTPVLGYFDEDDVPDALVVFLRGTFPAYTEAVHAIVSGADGAVVWQESIGSLSMAGGVAIDLDADGFDEALLLASHADAEPDTEEQLHLLEPRTRSSRAFGPPLGSTLPVSPWVGELDVDGCVDLVVPELHTDDDGIRARVTRFRIRAPVPDSISWGGYLGTHFDAELRPRRQR
ncbi:MAG TPA: hypothetical protein VGK73_01410, partial [Polyangiaceae bacterium]